MTDPFDADLCDRLGNLAAAVPVDAPGATSVVRSSVRSGSTGGRLALGGLVSLLAVVVVGTIVAGLAKVGPFAGSTENRGPVVATTVEGDFELQIRSEHARYRPDEPIQVTGRLTYRGDSTSISIWHGHSSPMSFGIVEPVNGMSLAPGWRGSRETSTLERGVPLVEPFAATAGFDANDPAASAYQDWFSTKEHRLPAGDWHLFVVAHFGRACLRPPEPCGGMDIAQLEIRADIKITVGPDTARELTASPGPSASPNPPQTVTVRDGDLELTMRSDKTRYMSDEAIGITASLLYLGPNESVEIDGITFGSLERVYDAILMPAITTANCVPNSGSTVRRGVPFERPFSKSGSYEPDHPSAELFNAFLADPVLRLPPGTWHLFAVASSECMSAILNGYFDIEARIKIEVVGPPSPPVPSPTPSPGPDSSPGAIQPDGSVVDEVEDGTFALRIEAGESEYPADAPIDISTTLTYLGPDPSVLLYNFGPPIRFQIEQLDASSPSAVSRLVDAACSASVFTRDVDNDAPIDFVERASGDGVDGAWLAANLQHGILRLPAGEWRITAYFRGSFETCSNGSNAWTGLQASIDIKVASTTRAEIPLRTASGPVVACPLAFGSGWLTPDPRSGLGLANSIGEVRAMIWPFGYTARQGPDGAVLIDPEGNVVAREGDRVIFGGAIATAEEGWSYACAGIEVVENPSP